MKIWHFSDPHSHQLQLTVPTDVDMAICSGDMSDFASTANKNWYNNEPEMRAFIDWFGNLPIKYKICIAGNHDVSIEKNLITKKDFDQACIDYLENDFVEIEGLKIWGSPHTPTFGRDWAFNKSRTSIDRVWQHIPEDTDIVVVHTPPKGILDLSYNRENVLEFCGCSALRKRLLKIEPTLCLFGHIHNNEDIINAGIMKLTNYKTIFSNGAVVTDGKFGKVTSHGNILEI